MSWFQKIVDIATGGFADKIIEVAEKYWPPEMSEQDKHLAKLELQALEQERLHQIEKAAAEGDQALTERIKSLEGTANDLKTIPIIGALVIFLRGVQRPLWGFYTLWLDYQWFAEWTLTDKQETALILINVLVLGFLFGERTLRNLQPIIEKVWGNGGKA